MIIANCFLKLRLTNCISTVFVSLAAFALFFLGIEFSEAKIIDQVFVKKVKDGDSIQVVYAGKTIEVRLWGIDAPEYRQPYSRVAKNFTKKLIQGKPVSLVVKDIDKYGRMVALVIDGTGAHVNSILIKNGYAWVHPYFCKEAMCEKWRQLEAEARKKKQGLWREPNPTPPWVYKRNKRKSSLK